MSSLSLFDDDELANLTAVPPDAGDAVGRVPGLGYRAAFITPAEEAELLAHVDAAPWTGRWQRRTQYYGERYAPRDDTDTAPDLPIPAWADPFRERLHAAGIFERLPTQVGVNEYLPGQGISAHMDYFGGTVVSLSLGSGCVMDFERPGTPERRWAWLEPRSIVILQGDARHMWTHGIARRRKDIVGGAAYARTRRVSITFRDIRR